MKPNEKNYYIALVKFEDSKTFRLLTQKTVKDVEKQIKEQCGGKQVTAKKMFEIDRITGSFEEF